MGSLLSISHTVLPPFEALIKLDVSAVRRLVRKVRAWSKEHEPALTTLLLATRDEIREAFQAVFPAEREFSRFWRAMTGLEGEDAARNDKPRGCLVFLAGLLAACKGTLYQKIATIFGLFDFDRDRSISVTELVIMFQATCYGLCLLTGHERPSARELEIIAQKEFIKYDENSDKKISLRELRTMIKGSAVSKLVLGLFEPEEVRESKLAPYAPVSPLISPIKARRSGLWPYKTLSPNSSSSKSPFSKSPAKKSPSKASPSGSTRKRRTRFRFPSLSKSPARASGESKRNSSMLPRINSKSAPGISPARSPSATRKLTFGGGKRASTMSFGSGKRMSKMSHRMGKRASSMRLPKATSSSSNAPSPKAGLGRRESFWDSNVRDIEYAEVGGKKNDRTKEEKAAARLQRSLVWEQERAERRQKRLKKLAKKREMKIKRDRERMLTIQEKRELTTVENLRKQVSRKIFSRQECKAVAEGTMPPLSSKRLDALELKKLYQVTLREVNTNPMFRSKYPRGTSSAIVELCETMGQRDAGLESFADFLHVLYPRMSDEDVVVWVRTANSTVVNKKFLEVMYQVFLTLDTDYTSMVQRRPLVRRLKEIPRFQPHTRALCEFVAQADELQDESDESETEERPSVAKEEISFPTAVLELFWSDEENFEKAKKIFRSGFMLVGPVSAKKLKEYREMFSRYDGNHDGVISHSEMTDHLMNVKKVAKSQKMVDEMFAEMDTDGDGVVEFDEFVSFHRRLERSITKQCLSAKEFDDCLYLVGKRMTLFKQKQRGARRAKRKALKKVSQALQRSTLSMVKLGEEVLDLNEWKRTAQIPLPTPRDGIYY